MKVFDSLKAYIKMFYLLTMAFLESKAHGGVPYATKWAQTFGQLEEMVGESGQSKTPHLFLIGEIHTDSDFVASSDALAFNTAPYIQVFLEGLVQGLVLPRAFSHDPKTFHMVKGLEPEDLGFLSGLLAPIIFFDRQQLKRPNYRDYYFNFLTKLGPYCQQPGVFWTPLINIQKALTPNNPTDRKIYDEFMVFFNSQHQLKSQLNSNTSAQKNLEALYNQWFAWLMEDKNKNFTLNYAFDFAKSFLEQEKLLDTFPLFKDVKTPIATELEWHHIQETLFRDFLSLTPKREESFCHSLAWAVLDFPGPTIARIGRFHLEGVVACLHKYFQGRHPIYGLTYNPAHWPPPFNRPSPITILDIERGHVTHAPVPPHP